MPGKRKSSSITRLISKRKSPQSLARVIIGSNRCEPSFRRLNKPELSLYKKISPQREIFSKRLARTPASAPAPSCFCLGDLGGSSRIHTRAPHSRGQFDTPSYSAPRPGLEPGTFSLHIVRLFQIGVDYIIILSDMGRFH